MKPQWDGKHVLPDTPYREPQVTGSRGISVSMKFLTSLWMPFFVQNLTGYVASVTTATKTISQASPSTAALR